MDAILNWYIDERKKQIRTFFQSVSLEEATSVENDEAMNISDEFFEIAKMSSKLRDECAAKLLEMNEVIDTTESKMEMLLQTIITLETQEKDKKFCDVMTLAVIYFNMGRVNLKLQKLNIVEAHYITCMQLLKDKELEHIAIITVLKALILLHVFYKWSQPEKCDSFLDTAMELYSNYTRKGVEYTTPVEFDNIFNNYGAKNYVLYDSVSPKLTLENIHLDILLNMLELYKQNRCNKHKFVIYVHDILHCLSRLILDENYVQTIANEYYVHWTITACQLSQYLANHYCFTAALNHIVAAEYVIMLFYEEVVKKISKEDNAALYESVNELFSRGSFSVYKYLGMYGAELLIESTKRLLPREEDENKSCERDNSKSELVIEYEDDLRKLLFTNLDKLEDNIIRLPDKCVSNFEDAKTIFVTVLSHFNSIKEFFSIEKYPVDFLEIKTALSKVYKCLATFEQDKSRQLVLHKRRAKIWQDVSGKLENSSYNFEKSSFEFQTIIIKTMNELIGVYITFLNIETDPLQLNVEQIDRFFTEETRNKINSSVQSIISLLQNIINHPLYED